jgi:hypothetical protein
MQSGSRKIAFRSPVPKNRMAVVAFLKTPQVVPDSPRTDKHGE